MNGMTHADMIRIGAVLLACAVGVALEMWWIKRMDARRDRETLQRFWKGHKK